MRCRALTGRPAPIAAGAVLAMGIAAPCLAADSLEEVFVTARKVREDVVDVPLSIQVVAGADLERLNVTSLYDLQFSVPGLVLNNRGMFGAGIGLRGVTDEGGTNLAIAPHVNGVYLGRSNLALARMFDVERVEVLKGPQGTLYGRNATGGAINVVTRGPGEEFSGEFEAAYGSFDTARMRGAIDLPAGKFATRIAVVGSEGHGYIRNSVDARRFSEEDYRAARLSFRVEPSERVNVNVMLQQVDDDGASSELWSPRPDFLPDPNDIRLTTVTLADPYLVTRDQLVNVDIAWQFDGFTLRSVTGYAKNATRSLDDCAGVLPRLRNCVRSVLPLRYEEWSEELRLESNSPTSGWVVGAFAYRADDSQRFRQLAPVISPLPVNDNSNTSAERAYALFGQTARAFGEHWRATAGLRYSYEERRVGSVGTGLQDNRVPRTASDSWSDPSWQLGVERRTSENSLWFASVSTGFKSGGVTTEILPGGAFDGYRAEHLLAWEAGLTAQSADRGRTVRASAFVYDFDDMQVRTTRVLSTGITTDTDNAAKVRIEGLDVSASAAIGRGVALSGALVWMPRREFVEYIDAITGAQLTGNVISRAPEWAVSANVDYRIQLARLGVLSAELGYNYRSSFFFSKENLARESQRSVGLLDVSLRLESVSGRWYAFATARNVLSEDYFNQIFLQSSPGKPATYEAGFGVKL